MFLTAAAFLVACMVLGGGTRPGFAGDAILQMLAIPILLSTVWRLEFKATSGAGRLALVFCGLLLVVPLWQLLPLPVAWMGHLAAHRDAQETWALTGYAPAFVPVSIAPSLTAQSALAVLPPLAVFGTTMTLAYVDRRRLSLLLIGVGVFSVIYGLLQLAQGPRSLLRLYATTNPYDAVGLFANRNHFAALCATVLVLLAAWYSVLGLSSRRGGRRPRLPRPLDRLPPAAALTATALIAIALLAGEITTRSRGGLILTVLACCGAIVLVRSKASISSQSKLIAWGSAAALGLVVIFIAQGSVLPLLDRFANDPLADSRLPFARNTLAAAADNPIVGTGMGTFPVVYGAYSKLTDEVAYIYANRAHDDYLELYLESGIVGLAVLAVFVVGMAWLGWRLWSTTEAAAHPIDQSLARAGFIIVLLLGLHSVVDYPLRTAALAAVLAFSCGLLIPPTTSAEVEVAPRGRAASQRSRL